MVLVQISIHIYIYIHIHILARFLAKQNMRELGTTDLWNFAVSQDHGVFSPITTNIHMVPKGLQIFRNI